MDKNRMWWTEDWLDWSWSVALSLMGAGALFGLAVQFGWLDLSYMSNSCGGAGQPCPEGGLLTLLLSILFFIAALWWGFYLFLEFDSPRDWLLAAFLVVTSAVLALEPGWQFVSWLRGPVAERA